MGRIRTSESCSRRPESPGSSVELKKAGWEVENKEGGGRQAGEGEGGEWFDLGCNCDNDKRPVEISYGDQKKHLPCRA